MEIAIEHREQMKNIIAEMQANGNYASQASCRLKVVRL